MPEPTEGAFSPTGEGQLTPADELHAEALRLFEGAHQPFTRYDDGSEEPYRGGHRYVRYRDPSQVDGAIVTLFDSGSPIMPWREESGATPLPTTTIDTPLLPPNTDWPNAYVRETLIPAPKSFRSATNPYYYSLAILEFTPEGVYVTGQNKGAIESEHRPLDDHSYHDRELSPEEGLRGQRLADLEARKLLEAREAFPDIMARFDPECSAEHFVEQLALLKKLSAEDEVGFDPSPYVRT